MYDARAKKKSDTREEVCAEQSIVPAYVHDPCARECTTTYMRESISDVCCKRLRETREYFFVLAKTISIVATIDTSPYRVTYIHAREEECYVQVISHMQRVGLIFRAVPSPMREDA